MDLQNDTIERMKAKADSLNNGRKGDLDLLCEVVADLAHVTASVAKHGCFRMQELHDLVKKPVFNWPMAFTALMVVGAVVGLILKFHGK